MRRPIILLVAIILLLIVGIGIFQFQNNNFGSPPPTLATDSTLQIAIATFDTEINNRYLTAEAETSPIPKEVREATDPYLIATRTAVALTLNPSLATPSTATSLEMTITPLLESYHLTRAAPTQTSRIGNATLAVLLEIEPALCYTLLPLTTDVNSELNKLGVKDILTIAGNYSVGKNGYCKTDLRPFEVRMSMGMSVSDMSDDYLTSLIEKILNVLPEIPNHQLYKLESTRLMITFYWSTPSLVE